MNKLEEYCSLKIAQGDIFQLVSTSSVFQRIKLPISTKFHAGITFCTIHVISSPTIHVSVGEMIFNLRYINLFSLFAGRPDSSNLVGTILHCMYL